MHEQKDPAHEIYDNNSDSAVTGNCLHNVEEKTFSIVIITGDICNEQNAIFKSVQVSYWRSEIYLIIM